MLEEALLANDWMLKGFSQFRLDAANLSYRDLKFASVILAKDQVDARSKATPAVTDMISANMIPAPDIDKDVAPKPYIIKEVSGKRFGKPVLKVGIIGLTQPGPSSKAGMIVENPIEKLAKVLPEVRSKVDLVVVLGYLPLDQSKQIAEKYGNDIDVIIASNATAIPYPAQREGKTVLVYSINQTKSLGELRLYLDDKGKVTDYLNRYILLDTAIPDVAEAAQINETAKKEVEAVKARNKSQELQNQPVGINVPAPDMPQPQPPTPDKKSY